LLRAALAAGRSLPAPQPPQGKFLDFYNGVNGPWRLGGPISAELTETINGVPSLMIAFIRPDIPAWFRVWVRQSDGIVVREDMRAEGHLMDHTFANLNGPISIQPPQ